MPYTESSSKRNISLPQECSQFVAQPRPIQPLLPTSSTSYLQAASKISLSVASSLQVGTDSFGINCQDWLDTMYCVLFTDMRNFKKQNFQGMIQLKAYVIYNYYKHVLS